MLVSRRKASNKRLSHVVEKLPSFHELIRNEIEQLLQKTEGNQMRMNLVARAVMHHVPKDKHKNVVYRIIENMPNIQKNIVLGKVHLKLKK